MTIVVDDNDCVIDYYTNKRCFMLVEDTPQQGKSWVVVASNPETSQSCAGDDYPALFRKNYKIRLTREIALYGYH